WPYRILKKVPALHRVAETIPLKQYANFPFRVCVNDQLDRLSAPIENRYTKADVEDWFNRAKLQTPQINPNFGCAATRRKRVTDKKGVSVNGHRKRSARTKDSSTIRLLAL